MFKIGSTGPSIIQRSGTYGGNSRAQGVLKIGLGLEGLRL